jgi:hypothetical protein
MNSQNPLINRMNVDKINVLLAELQKYPTTIQNCIDDMMNTTTWCDLKYDTICTLNDVFRMGYNPTNVASLFNNK